MKTIIIIALGLFLQGQAFAQSPYASLQVPQQIQYQGRVTTGTGAAWAGTEGYFVFALVQGATVLWNNWEGITNPSDPGTVSLGAGQVLTLPVSSGVFSIRLGEGSDTNEQIPPTVFFDATSNAVRSSVKLAVWFSADGGAFTRLAPDVEFTSVPFAMVAGIAESMKERAVTEAMVADGAIANAKIQAGSVTSDKVADGSLGVTDFSPELRQTSVIPPGTIMPFAGVAANLPDGWMLCDGTAVSRMSYPALFAAIGTNWGAGNGSTTFAVPNLAGAMLVGTGTGMINGRNKVGPAIGTFQEDQMQGHEHTSWWRQAGSNGSAGSYIAGRSGEDPGAAWKYTSGIVQKGAYGNPRYGDETRVYAAGINYIIKY